MRYRLSVWAVVIGVLCVPLAYAAVFDVAVRVAIAADLLKHEQVSTASHTYKITHEGEDEGGRECAITVHEPGRAFAPTYPVPCDRPAGDGTYTAEVVPGIFTDEVVSLGGSRIWHGEPSEELTWLTALLYAGSYMALLYALCYGLLRRWPALRAKPSRLKGLALAPAAIGAGIGYVGVLAVSIFWADPMWGVIAGMLAAAAICLRLGRREPPASASD